MFPADGLENVSRPDVVGVLNYWLDLVIFLNIPRVPYILIQLII